MPVEQEGDHVIVTEGAQFGYFDIDEVFRGKIETSDGRAYAPDGLVLKQESRESSSHALN